jgi:hypothetical protein
MNYAIVRFSNEETLKTLLSAEDHNMLIRDFLL